MNRLRVALRRVGRVGENLDRAARARDRADAAPDGPRPAARHADECLLIAQSGEQNIGRLVADIDCTNHVSGREIDDAYRIRQPVGNPGFAIVTHGDADRLQADRNLGGENWRPRHELENR